MFKKKKWLIVSILAAAVVVAMGAMGVSAYAKSNSSPVSVAPAGNTASETAPARGLIRKRYWRTKWRLS